MYCINSFAQGISQRYSVVHMSIQCAAGKTNQTCNLDLVSTAVNDSGQQTGSFNNCHPSTAQSKVHIQLLLYFESCVSKVTDPEANPFEHHDTVTILHNKPRKRIICGTLKWNLVSSRRVHYSRSLSTNPIYPRFSRQFPNSFSALLNVNYTLPVRGGHAAIKSAYLFPNEENEVKLE